MKTSSQFLFAAFLTLFVSLSHIGYSQDLQRRAMLGIAFEDVSSQVRIELDLGNRGVRVLEVLPNTSAASLGILVQDIILELNGNAIESITDVQKHLVDARAGDEVRLLVLRDETEVVLLGQLKSRPKEDFGLAHVDLGQFSFDGGVGRLITVTPDPNKKLPAVFFIPGFSCMTVDGLQPWHPYRKFFEGIVEAGFVLVRAEKPGMGDSKSDIPCSSCSYETELESFRAAYREMLESPFVDKNNIVIFGHSLGGIQAPVLGGEFQPAGIAVYGTTYVPWLEYLLRVNRFQHRGFGIDPLQIEQQAKAAYPVLTRIMVDGESPSDIAEESAAYRGFLQSMFQWQSGDLLFGRSHMFWKGIQDQMTLQHWSEYEGQVLSLYGGADVHTVDGRDQEDLVEILNGFNEQSAQFVDLQTIDHNFVETGGLEQTYEALSSGSYQDEFFMQRYSPMVVQTFVKWAQSVINT